MATTIPINLVPVIEETISEISDKNRLSRGIEACLERGAGPDGGFSSRLEMQLAGIAMIPEARDLMTAGLSRYWRSRRFPGNNGITDYSRREIVIGGGFHAAVYCANRVRMGFPKPVVLEKGSADQVGGAFAVSLKPVFRLNSRNRPGTAGLPDQDKALNYLPSGLLQPSMITSEEYPTNADMAWLIRLTLAQYADLYPDVTVTRFSGQSREEATVTIAGDDEPVLFGRVLDARGAGLAEPADSPVMLTFGQFMARMGGMFPLRGMNQIAVIGSGDSARCAVESLLGIAPGHTSAIGLDYVTRTDWYTGGDIGGRTCSEFRDGERGRYIRIAQYLQGNASNPSTRLRVMDSRGYATPMPDGVLVGDRTYDMAIVCTGGTLPEIDPSGLIFYEVFGGDDSSRGTTQLASSAQPFPLYRIGPAANIPFSLAERQAGVADIPANRVAMFRLAPRTAALAATLRAAGNGSGS